MQFIWNFFIDFGILSATLLLATFLRSKIKILQTYLIPNSLTAGFILLFYYNYLAPRLGQDTISLENIVFHFLNISFIAMTLRIRKDERKKHSNRDVWATGITVLFQYALQCFFGTLLALGLIYTFIPDLFPGFGLFATLGFSLGPGQAYAIGQGWEAYGYPGLGSVGLTFGAIGFILASFGGIFLVNYGLRKGWVKKQDISQIDSRELREGVAARGSKLKSEKVYNITNPEAIDPLTFNVSLVLGTYLLTYLLLRGLNILLGFAGNLGMELANNLWGIMFIFCALTAMLVKAGLKAFKIDYIVDNDRLTRLSGFSVDYMVTSAIAAISIAVVTQYWLPIVVIASVCGVITMITHIWISSRIFSDHVFFRSILVFGCVTGTLPTGLALLRTVDPGFETPASHDYMYASGFVFLFAIPIILTANLPGRGAAEGSLIPTYIVLGMYAVYIIACFVAYFILSGRRRFKQPSSFWLNRKNEEADAI